VQENELEYYYPYRIEKENNFRHHLKNFKEYYDQLMGKNEYYFKDEGNYGFRRNIEHFTEEEYARNDYVLTEFMTWKNWFEKGKNIFSFTPELLLMLNKTDVSDITYESFNLPYDDFFVSLKSLRLKIADDSEKIIDGVYISIDRQAMEDNLNFEDTPKISYDYVINFRFVGDFEEIRLRSFDKIWDGYGNGAGGFDFWNYSFFFISEKNIFTIREGIDDAKELFKTSYFPENNHEVKDVHLDALNYHCNFIEKTSVVLVNVLLYLSLPKECKEIDEKYPSNLPHNLNRKLKFSKSQKDKIKVERKIKETGFSKIQFVGNSFVKYRCSEKGLNEKSSHWRRGHWRNQIYGKGLKEKRLIWIKPAIVNKKMGKPKNGHIYEVGTNINN
jgi:hypothetical protein